MLCRRNGGFAGLLAAVVLLAAAVAPASASPPAYDGSMVFMIEGPSDPEEFTWQVVLGPGQHLEQRDDRHVAVVYDDGTDAMTIEAVPAHDSNGAGVPTSLALSEGDLITLTVHHRAGNPATGGAPFAYPVTAGPAFKIGEGTVTVETLPDGLVRETRERIERESPPATLTPPELRQARRIVVRACGKVERVPVRAHGVACRTARRVYRANLRGELPEGWVCSASLARCYAGDFDSRRFFWWRQSRR